MKHLGHEVDAVRRAAAKAGPANGIARLMQQLNPYDPDRLKVDDIQPIRIEESRTRSKAARMVVVSFIGFAIWAVLAPIDSGANVTGTVVVMGNRKAVQHPSGGVVESIAVREGSVVRKGDVLLTLNQLAIDAALNSNELDYINSLAAESRLMAERNDSRAIVWMPELDSFANDPRAQEARLQQARLFMSRRNEIQGQLRILNEQIAGLSGQASELEKVIAARSKQASLMSQEAVSNKQLAVEGFVPMVRVSELERAHSDLQASVANASSELGKARSSIAATRLQLLQTLAVYRRDLEVQLAETKKLRGAARAKVESLKFDMSLTDVRAPVSGTVVALKINTVGGVIQAGTVLMEVVPGDQELIIEAQVPPAMIDKVRVGLPADMRFTAFNLNTTPVIPGEVRLVGADRLPGTTREQPNEYYLAQIKTTQDGLRMLGALKVQAGMPVDVVIKTGERSFMSYLVKPLTDRFAMSFKEH
jgi:protease secretion system membrane fusion protein